MNEKNATIYSMKKFILLTGLIFVLTLCVFSQGGKAYADDTSNKVVAESLNDFSFENYKDTVELKVIEETSFENGVKFEKDAIIKAKVAKIVDPKRGKRNGYLVVDPVSYSIPSENITCEIEDEYWMANVMGYKPFDTKQAALSASLGAAGYFVKGIGQIFYFGKGIISPDEGENRLKSGVKNVYENSPLVYIEEGERVDIKKGDILLLKFYHSDVPKWRPFKRNK